MNLNFCDQRGQEWYEIKKGRIGGTRLGQAISGRKNRMIYELLNEQLADHIFMDDYISDDMQFGIDNEPIARQLYSEQSGIEFNEVGLIRSELYDIHIASPDGISADRTIALEIKCTMNGYVHLQRFFEGVEPAHLPQIINYFAVADEIKEVHWVSYCPERTERPLIIYVFERATYADSIRIAREKVAEIQKDLDVMKSKYLPVLQTVEF